jgi:hypothetical protein
MAEQRRIERGRAVEVVGMLCDLKQLHDRSLGALPGRLPYSPRMDLGWPELLVLVAVFVVLCATLARHKGRSIGPWIALGLIFGPIALIVLALLPSKRALTPAPTTTA